MTTFIYQPKSGDRVFAQNPHGEMAVILWDNSCRHVVGGVQLCYSTCTPKQYWRLEAKRMAGELVRVVGGIAWDEQGTISLIVPVRDAFWAHEYMLAACRASGVAPGNDLRNDAALVLAGYALEGHATGGGIRGVASWSDAHSIPVWVGWSQQKCWIDEDYFIGRSQPVPQRYSVTLHGYSREGGQPCQTTLTSPWTCREVNQGAKQEFSRLEAESWLTPPAAATALPSSRTGAGVE